MSLSKFVTLIRTDDGYEEADLSPSALFAPTEEDMNRNMRLVLTSWQDAPGHVSPQTAALYANVAFTYVAAFALTVRSNSIGGATVAKTWSSLVKTFGGKHVEAVVLKRWTLVVPPMAPRSITTVIFDGPEGYHSCEDFVTRVYNPAEAHKTRGKAVVHLLRKSVARRFVDTVLVPVQ